MIGNHIKNRNALNRTQMLGVLFLGVGTCDFHAIRYDAHGINKDS